MSISCPLHLSNRNWFKLLALADEVRRTRPIMRRKFNTHQYSLFCVIEPLGVITSRPVLAGLRSPYCRAGFWYAQVQLR
jgi:hypothetical protein